MLKKVNRINKKSEIDKFFGLGFGKTGGRNFANDFFVLKCKINRLTQKIRFGFVVANKVDNRATVRNKIKRRLREITRKYLPKYICGLEIMIIAKPGIKSSDFKSLENEFLKIMAKGRFFKAREQ